MCHQAPTKHGDLCLCPKGSQSRNKHVCTWLYKDRDRCPVLHGKGEEIFILLSQQHVLSHMPVAGAPLLPQAAATSVA